MNIDLLENNRLKDCRHQDLLRSHRDAQGALNQLKQYERELRDEIVRRITETNAEDNTLKFKIKDQEGTVRVTVKQPYSYSPDKRLKSVAGLPLEIRHVFREKKTITVDARALKALPEEHRVIADHHITMKPAAPTISYEQMGNSDAL